MLNKRFLCLEPDCLYVVLQDSALAKMDLLVTETEEMAEQILEWREKQKGIFCDNSQLSVESDSCFKSVTPY